MNRKIEQYEAIIAIDRISKHCNGIIAFSRANNRITFFAVSRIAKYKETAEKLITVALRQLNTNNDIIVSLPNSNNLELISDRNFFCEDGFEFVNEINIDGCPMVELSRKGDDNIHGDSFHYNYPKFIRASKKQYCPCTIDSESSDTTDEIFRNDFIWVHGEYPGQGRLFGKLCVIPLEHYFHFEDMPVTYANKFMNEVQHVGRALREVTGAMKINYEMHANSGAHIYIHLFPRYLDDDYPSAAIDFRVSESPYESYEEYLWFIQQMKKHLNNNIKIIHFLLNNLQIFLRFNKRCSVHK